VLQLFPFVALLAPATSVAMLLMLYAADELRLRFGVPATMWFAVAAWCQFFGGSPVVGAAGLALQTLLAVVLIVRWRLSV
jgi:hypothetical protein